MRPLMLLPFAALVIACGGAGPRSATPELGPTLAIEQFLRAAADSNLNQMAELWGTGAGSAARTGQPQDYRRRIQIMHAYLKGNTAKVLGVREDKGDRVVMVVELIRPGCRRQVPFTAIRRGKTEWLVSAVDLAAIGAPGARCTGDTPPRDPPV